ncbi:MAG: aminoglycoside phosphotransferase family protein [Flavobacteriaceae bacterium]|jgi:aminoglycoside/choline kinase family phosphotransferase|nr:aminoglycoside phosphotransferase family protein [Flavobacteriaceae bacterium]
MIRKKAQHFFEKFAGEKATDFSVLAQSGSARINFLAANSKQKFIVTFNENLSENEAFFYFSNLFSDLKLNTPKIFEISEDRKIYVQEFLGEQTLSEIIENEGFSERVKSLVKQSLEKLFWLQQKTSGKVDYSKTFEYETYDELPIFHDLNYFKFLFVDIVGANYHKSSLLKEFRELTKKIENISPKGLMMRDFQARNIIVSSENKISFIDYQAAMKGPLMYDVVSFLYQAKANFSEDFRGEMLEFYYALWNDETKISELKLSLKPLQLIRYLQVLGVYGLRGLVQKKPHFIKSIDKGLDNLKNFSENWEEIENFPELKKLIFVLNSPETRMKILNSTSS